MPETRYAKSGDLSIAYQVFGEGPLDIALDVWWFNHVDAQWDVPPLARLLRRFAAFSRVIVFDKRGLGLSDPVQLSDLPSLEQWMDDQLAVLADSEIERVAMVGGNGGGIMPMLFAATYPERVRALVLVDAFADVGVGRRLSVRGSGDRDRTPPRVVPRLGPRRRSSTRWRRASRTSRASARSGLATSAPR